jgi:hypothetical protein
MALLEHSQCGHCVPDIEAWRNDGLRLAGSPGQIAVPSGSHVLSASDMRTFRIDDRDKFAASSHTSLARSLLTIVPPADKPRTVVQHRVAIRNLEHGCVQSQMALFTLATISKAFTWVETRQVGSYKLVVHTAEMVVRCGYVVIRKDGIGIQVTSDSDAVPRG